jgi:hypothetical protein
MTDVQLFGYAALAFVMALAFFLCSVFLSVWVGLAREQIARRVTRGIQQGWDMQEMRDMRDVRDSQHSRDEGK